MEGDFVKKRPLEEGTTSVPIKSSTEVNLRLPNYQEDFIEIDAQWNANIRETRICRNVTLISAIAFFAIGMSLIIVLVVFTMMSFAPTTANLVGIFLTDVIGAITGVLTGIVGGALFKYYQSLQQDLQMMWSKINKLKQDQKEMERIVHLLGTMKNEAEKDALIAEAVRSIIKNIIGN